VEKDSLLAAGKKSGEVISKSMLYSKKENMDFIRRLYTCLCRKAH
jgi:hypothetical protein